VTVFHDRHPHPVNLVCINADQHFVVMERDEAFFEDRYNIGVWNWELPTFPEEWHDRFDHYDEIWAGSSMIVHALSSVAPIPIVRMPPVLTNVARGDRRRGRRALKARPAEHLFLFVFDFHSYFERKNPLAVVQAFKRAFGRSDQVRLVLKCVNGSSDDDSMNSLRDASEGLRVDLLVDYVPYQRLCDLLAACDTYVSLHRSEGIGLTIAEAMALGKPVIATGWSGNVDFMDVSNSFPVSFAMTEIKEDVGPYRAGQVWAEPSIEHAAALMREVVVDRELAASRGAAARRHIESNFSTLRVGQIMAERLAVVEERRFPAHNRAKPGLPFEFRDASTLKMGMRSIVPEHTPEGSIVAVVSKGDPDLIAIDGRTGWHFPQTGDGTYAGFYPKDSTSAINHLEQVRERGATHFVVPSTSAWWLDYYRDLRAHLDLYYDLVVSDETCTIYRLSSPEPAFETPSEPVALGTEVLSAEHSLTDADSLFESIEVPTSADEGIEISKHFTVTVDGPNLSDGLPEQDEERRPIQIGITVLVGKAES
jgi:glycosyltransferase involved in cell wall biosynthesis